MFLKIVNMMCGMSAVASTDVNNLVHYHFLMPFQVVSRRPIFLEKFQITGRQATAGVNNDQDHMASQASLR